MTTLLAQRINTLHLRSDAPFPSEVRDGHDMVLQWRQTQRLSLVMADTDNARDPDDYSDDGEMT